MFIELSLQHKRAPLAGQIKLELSWRLEYPGALIGDLKWQIKAINIRWLLTLTLEYLTNVGY